jgi:beta-galactosidase beta subunit
LSEGIENIGWKPRQKYTKPIGEYNAEKDVLFYNDNPDMFSN